MDIYHTECLFCRPREGGPACRQAGRQGSTLPKYLESTDPQAKPEDDKILLFTRLFGEYGRQAFFSLFFIDFQAVRGRRGHLHRLRAKFF